MENKFLTTKQLAERWQMGEKALQIWRQQGKGPRYLKQGEGRTARILYNMGDIEEYENKNTRQGTNEEKGE